MTYEHTCLQQGLDRILKKILKIILMLQSQNTETIFVFGIFVHRHQQIEMEYCLLEL